MTHLAFCPSRAAQLTPLTLLLLRSLAQTPTSSLAFPPPSLKPRNYALHRPSRLPFAPPRLVLPRPRPSRPTDALNAPAQASDICKIILAIFRACAPSIRPHAEALTLSSAVPPVGVFLERGCVRSLL